MRKKIIFIIFIIGILLFPLIKVKASDLNTNNNAGYTIIIEDDANLLTNAQEQKLRDQLIPLTEFGYVMFKTTNTNDTSTPLRYIQNYYYSKLGNKSGVAFYIDMNKRQICACATGGLDRIITSSKCDTIMDNVYKYASQKNYYECSVQAFLQMNRLLNGEKIAESMKYICNGIVAIMLSLFASYGFIMMISQNKKASKKELIDECEIKFDHSEIDVKRTGTHSVYSPVSDSSSSGGSSGGGGRRRRRLLWKWRKPWLLKSFNNTKHFKMKCFSLQIRKNVV